VVPVNAPDTALDNCRRWSAMLVVVAGGHSHAYSNQLAIARVDGATWSSLFVTAGPSLTVCLDHGRPFQCF
jgi:hypothetical protein